MERTGPQVHVEPTRCPYCHEGIPRGEAPAVCPACHALHHAECAAELGCCAACKAELSAPGAGPTAATYRLERPLQVTVEVEPPQPPRVPAEREPRGAPPGWEGFVVIALVIALSAGVFGTASVRAGGVAVLVGLVLVDLVW